MFTQQEADKPGFLGKFSEYFALSYLPCYKNTISIFKHGESAFFFLPTAPDLLSSGEQGSVDPHLAALLSNLLVFVDFVRSKWCDEVIVLFSSYWVTGTLFYTFTCVMVPG